jgi:hypothetical protein
MAIPCFSNYKDCYIQTPYSFQNQSISENHGIFLKQQKYFESKQGLVTNDAKYIILSSYLAARRTELVDGFG